MVWSIAVVEDSPLEVAQLKDYISQYSTENNVNIKVTHFESGLLFLEKYNPIYDIVLLDIGLPEMDGMETAVRLREIDKSTTIIFVTNMAQFAVRGYEVDAFDFVVKPVSYSNFVLKLKRALNKISSRSEKEIVITSGGNVYRLPSSHIKHIEIEGHNLTYYTTYGVLEAYGNLKEVEAKLGSKMFVRCNSCYLVNLNHVRAVEGYSVWVADKKLQISRPKRKTFMQSLNDFLGGGIG